MQRHRMQTENKLVSILFASLFMFSILLLPQPGRSLQSERESPIVQAVRKVSPAVVNISSSYAVRKRANPFSGFGLDPFFEDFFKDFFDPRFE
ncbi:MAG: hypothetical protein PVH94_10000, partial [Desulfobacterales bacterium]